MLDVTVIQAEIQNPALKALAGEILDTVSRVKNGKTDYKEGVTELSGYKQILQIMALEVMRHRLPVR